MADLYNISFTTRKMVRKFDKKNNVIGEEKMSNPITLTALPYKTAMSYSGCDDFQITEYVPEARPIRSSAAKGVGNGTKKVDWNAVEKGRSTGEIKTVKAGTGGKTAVQKAAETGDMAAAVNG